MKTRPLGAQISHMLRARGVEVIFGIPGVHNIEMYRGIEESGLTHILARHEQGAGFMADGYARATGRPGVAYVITGPGLCNTMTPLGQAYSDSVPVLAISSCLDETVASRGQLHQMRDQQGAAATVCAWSQQADTAQAAYALIDRALDGFALARPRPCHIQVPIAVAGAMASPPPDIGRVPARLAIVDHAVVQDVAARLDAARKPLFIFGGGARTVDFAGPLLQRWGAASFTTYAGRGVVPPQDPLHFGAMLARQSSANAIAESDLIIALGTELSEVDLWRDGLGHTAPLIRVDIDPEVLSDRHRAEYPVLGDVCRFLTDLGVALPEPLKKDWRAATIKTYRAAWLAELAVERPGITEICEALRAVMPDDAMIYSDMTQFAYGAKEIWPMSRPGHWHHPYGFGTLGYALPAAIGGAVGRPGSPTMAIAGDYGFQYTVQELGTAVELGLPLPILIWDNGKLKEIEDAMVRSQIAPNAVVARNPDFLALAKAYGANAVAPQNLDDLKSAVSQAFSANGPTVILMTPDLVTS